MSTEPLFVISLDFELYWGMFDKVSLETYGQNIKGAHEAIPELLALFKQNGIHATWATVGMLMSENKDDLLTILPKEEARPTYADARISSYDHIEHTSLGRDASVDPYHFGGDLVKAILQTPYQELGSHTFSHYYCLDGSENGEAIFAADCEAFKNVLQRFHTTATSIVFPRNQTTSQALHVCASYGFTAYRGTPDHVLYTGKKEKDQVNLFLRALRLVDAYINLSGHHTFTLESVRESALNNVRGSFFLRPYSKTLRAFEKLRLVRIKNAMTHAAKRGEIFHLWWHPHNFGVNRKKNRAHLIEILEHFAYLKRVYKMESASMKEVALRASRSVV
jgi:peptidoglycan/xylan/chitin deacetylase (PgdA/CDA1 family)